MKKTFLAIVLLFAVTTTFANANDCINSNEDHNTVLTIAGDVLDVQINFDEFDVCTITVTVRAASGNTYSATASNNQGDCDAAYNAARSHAFLMAAVFE